MKLNIENLIEEVTKQVLQQITNKGSLAQDGTSSPVQSANATLPANISLVTGPEIARMIDHTLLKPETTKDQIITLCAEAKEFGFATVCVNPYWVPLAAHELKGSRVGITTVIGFPLGNTSTFTKVAEARDAIASGATEVDMVMNIAAFKSGDLEFVKQDIAAVVQAVNKQAVVKVILETGFLNDEEKRKASMLCKMAGADFVKTSTGFGPGTATPEDIKLMRDTVGPDLGVKASGGVRDLDSARKMIIAGANRIGTSSGVAIVKGKIGEGY